MDFADQMHALTIADRNGGRLYYSDGSDSYTDSDMDVMSVRDESAAENGAEMESTRGCSPAPSVYSFHSSMDGHALREVHGRYFNSQNDTYMLPADEPERGRLSLQHDALLLAINSLYQNRQAVHEVLAPRADYTPAICDIGTGTGTWAITMAKLFPHAEVVGIDLANPKPQEAIPPNCRFEIDDANLGFPHFHNRFDVVHVRAITAGICDFQYFLRECSRMLRPGGIFLLADGDLQLYDDNFEGLSVCEEDDPGYSWLQRIFFATYNSMKNRGAAIDAMTLAPRWAREIPDFENVETQDIFIPVGPWIQGDRRVELASDLIRRDACLVIAGMKPMLLSEGYFEHTVDLFIEEALKEMDELRVHIYSLWHYTWARKTQVSTLPDEDTLKEMTSQQRAQLSAAQVMAPSGAAPGSAPIYPPAPPQLPAQTVDTRPSVNRPVAPGGCQPIVPHAPSRYDNFVPQPDPYAPFDYDEFNANPDPARYGFEPLPTLTLPTVTSEYGSLAALAQLQPEIFGPYLELHIEQVRQQQLYMQQRAEWRRQQEYFAMNPDEEHPDRHLYDYPPHPNYDEELARNLQRQLFLQDHGHEYSQPGPSSRPSHY